jgi:hypothetical protein
MLCLDCRPSDPAAMADLAEAIRENPALTEALHGRFTSHHAFLTPCHRI